MGQMDEAGFITIVGRRTDMIISGGFSIYSTEVKAAIEEGLNKSRSAIMGETATDWMDKAWNRRR